MLVEVKTPMQEIELKSATTLVRLRASASDKGLEIDLKGLGQVVSLQREGQEFAKVGPDGKLYAEIVGNVTGDLTGDVTGDLTGDVTGDLTGDVTGNVTGDVTGDLTGRAGEAAVADGIRMTETPPVNAARASLTTSLAGDNNDLAFSAAAVGEVGNDITVEYVHPHRASRPLAVSVAGTAISVSLETNDMGSMSSLVIGGDGNTVTVEVDDPGTWGDAFTLEFVVAATANAPLSAAIVGTAITVTLGTDANGDPDDLKNTYALIAPIISALDGVSALSSGNGVVSAAAGPLSFTGGADPQLMTTAAEVIDAIEESSAASALVTVANAPDNTGAGTVTAMEAAALEGGVDGTVGVANEVLHDGTWLYVCIAANPAMTGTNWRRVSLGTVY